MKKVVFLLFLFFVSACSTSYQPEGRTGGYTDIQLSKNVFSVSFSGNGFTSNKKTNDFALLRAAELMYRNNYPYFLVVDKANSSENSSYTTPVYASTNVYGNSIHTNVYGGQTYNSTKYSTDMVVIGLKDNQVGAYDTVIVLNSIAKQYDLDIVDIVNKKDDD